MPARVDQVSNRSTAPAAAPKADFKHADVGINHGDLSLNYEIKKGDTLSRIARQFGSDVATLFEMNGIVLENKDVIHPGEVIRLPTAFYVVKPGDTYSKIGREFGIDYKKLMALNEATSDRIKVGQELRVPAANTAEQQKVRSELKALVADSAKAEAMLYFGEGSMTTGSSDNTFWTSGPVESGRSYEFSADYKSVKIWDASSDDDVARLPVADVNAFRQIIVSDLMAGVLHTRAQQLSDVDPKRSARLTPEGPTVKDGTISYKMGRDSELVYDTRAGTLCYTAGTAEPRVVNAGHKPSEVAQAMAKLFKLSLPLY